METRRRLLALLLPVVVALAACGASDGDGRAGTAADGDEAGGRLLSWAASAGVGDDRSAPPGVDALAGRRWTLRFGAGPDGPIPRVEDHPITIEFRDDGRLGGTSACNAYGGAYRLDARGLQVDDLLATLVACGPDRVMESERQFLSALLAVDGIALAPDPTVGEQLILSGPAIELVFGP